MKFSSGFFIISLMMLIITPIFVITTDYYIIISTIIFAIIFFMVGVFLKIFEYLELLEERSRPTYEQFEEIFNKHFIKKRNKRKQKRGEV